MGKGMFELLGGGLGGGLGDILGEQMLETLLSGGGGDPRRDPQAAEWHVGFEQKVSEEGVQLHVMRDARKPTKFKVHADAGINVVQKMTDSSLMLSIPHIVVFNGVKLMLGSDEREKPDNVVVNLQRKKGVVVVTVLLPKNSTCCLCNEKKTSRQLPVVLSPMQAKAIATSYIDPTQALRLVEKIGRLLTSESAEALCRQEGKVGVRASIQTLIGIGYNILPPGLVATQVVSQEEYDEAFYEWEVDKGYEQWNAGLASTKKELAAKVRAKKVRAKKAAAKKAARAKKAAQGKKK